MTKPVWRNSETGEELPLSEEDERALKLLVQHFETFKLAKGRYPTQDELDEALKRGGLWERGVRISAPAFRAQA